MPDEEATKAPTWRPFGRRVYSVTVGDLRLLFDWKLPGRRLYGVKQGDCFHILAKLTVETDEPRYPCRASDYRDVSAGVKGVKDWRVQEDGSRVPVPRTVRQEYPCRSDSERNYPVGRFSTWLRTGEIDDAVLHNRIVACHILVFHLSSPEYERVWRRLRNEALQRHGRQCMRCGATECELHVDHVQAWAKCVEKRYSIENLQVLCRDCHAWKQTQRRALDFRPRSVPQPLKMVDAECGLRHHADSVIRQYR